MYLDINLKKYLYLCSGGTVQRFRALGLKLSWYFSRIDLQQCGLSETNNTNFHHFLICRSHNEKLRSSLCHIKHIKPHFIAHRCMGRLYIYPNLVDFLNDKSVGKYISPMDPTVDGQKIPTELTGVEALVTKAADAFDISIWWNQDASCAHDALMEMELGKHAILRCLLPSHGMVDVYRFFA